MSVVGLPITMSRFNAHNARLASGSTAVRDVLRVELALMDSTLRTHAKVTPTPRAPLVIKEVAVPVK